MSDNNEWPVWKCAALTAVLCLIPLLLLFEQPAVAGITWLVVIGLYLVLVRFFGKGFVVEGAVIVIILSMLLGIGLNAYFDWQNKREIDTVKTNAKASN